MNVKWWFGFIPMIYRIFKFEINVSFISPISVYEEPRFHVGSACVYCRHYFFCDAKWESLWGFILPVRGVKGLRRITQLREVTNLTPASSAWLNPLHSARQDPYPSSVCYGGRCSNYEWVILARSHLVIQSAAHSFLGHSLQARLVQ